MSAIPSEFGPVILNEAQRRHFGVLLGMLEDTLFAIERIAREDTEPARLRGVEHDLPGGFEAEMQREFAPVRARLHALADGLGLDMRLESDARRAHALLMAAIVRLEDSTSDRVRGYGAVDPSVSRVMDPVIGEMHASLTRLAARLAAPDGRREG